MHKDMTLAEIWDKTISFYDDGHGPLVVLRVQSDEKPTGLTAKNPFVASCDPVENGKWDIMIWRSQLEHWGNKNPEGDAGVILERLRIERAQAHEASLSASKNSLRPHP